MLLLQPAKNYMMQKACKNAHPTESNLQTNHRLAQLRPTPDSRYIPQLQYISPPSQPLSSVAEGMSILDRAQFTSTLFGGDEEVFSTLLSKLSKASTQEEAFAMFQESLCAHDAPEAEALKEVFAKRIMRTFVS